MDAKKLEILISAVDLGSFSKASETVGYTQSGLTHLVDALEKEIGIKLTKRTHKGVSLTENGQILMPFIRDFIASNAKLENAIKNINEKRNDTIRIAAYSSIAMHWMPEILYRFRRLCPDTTVELRMVDHALEPFELLRDGKTDVIFASRQEGYNCKWTPLYKERMFAILPKNHPAGSDEEYPITDFRECDFIMPWGRFDIEINSAFAKAGVEIKKSQPKVDDETVIRMVGAGLGVSMMSELMIRGRTDDVKCIPVTPCVTRELGMGVSHNDNSKEILLLKNCVTGYLNEKFLRVNK